MKAPKGYIVLSQFFKKHGGNYILFDKLRKKGYIVYGDDYFEVNAVHRSTTYIKKSSIGKIQLLFEKKSNPMW